MNGAVAAATERVVDAWSEQTRVWWTAIREEAEALCKAEPALAHFLAEAILAPSSFAGALTGYLAAKLANQEVSRAALAAIAGEAIQAAPLIVDAAMMDLIASKERNPAYHDHLTPFLYFKGFQALQWHRVTHWLWLQRRYQLATYLQSRVSEVFAVDIHPAARFGRGIFIDHATGLVVGETAVVGNDVSLLQGVTLGGTGKEDGDRHPKVGSGVLIGAGAKILGNITIGDCAKIGAGSVVLRSVPPHTTVAGVPARIVGPASEQIPALSMNQDFMVVDWHV
jgi:serine O-acetyltransferase